MAAVAAVVTFVMCLGEMILLSGQLYRFGSGFFFEGLGAAVLAPADICVIIASGAICELMNGGLFTARKPKSNKSENVD